MNFNIGDIYKIDTRVAPGPHRPYGGIIMIKRILSLDSVQVFSDYKDTPESTWLYDKGFRATQYFTRTPISIFEKYGRLIGHEEVPKQVLDVIRPDLPLAILRTRDISWTDSCFDDLNALNRYISADKDAGWHKATVNTPHLYLEPITVKETPKPAVLIEADNGRFFTAAELVWKAKEIRDTVNKTTSDGIGIFRSGVRKKLPMYYIGSYCDLAGYYCTKNKY